MNSAMQIRKHEIALMLAARYGYTSYLEICTSITGGTFSLVDKKQFPRRARLMYKCPPDFGDGEPIDFSTEAESGEELLADLVRSGEKFDLVFIDPWHTYTSSLRDIVFGLHLIKGDGVLVVHDCNPPNAACAEQEFHSGPWCGVTFAAYLDIVLFGELQEGAEQAESGEDEDVTECDRDSAQTPISTLDAKEHSQRSSEDQP
jgi:hypothetical protein